MRRTVRSDSGEVTVRETGIVHVRAFPNTEISLTDARAMHTMIEYVTRREPHCLVMDISGVTAISSEAKEYLQTAISSWKNTLAIALITPNVSSMMIGSFFIDTSLPTFPIQVFSVPQNAHVWARYEYAKATTRLAS